MKKILSLSVFSFSCLVSFAQLDNTVEVTNEAKPVVTDVKKMPVKTKPAETKVTHYTMQYAVEGQPLNNYAEEPLGDYSSEAVWKGKKNGYVQLGGGVQGNLDGQVTYQFNLTEQDALGVDFSLKGFNGHAADNKYYDVRGWKSRDYRNRTALKYNHFLDNGAEFYVKGVFENHLFNYMGDGLKTDKQHDVLGNVDLGLTPYKVDQFTFSADGGVDFFSQNYKTTLEKKLGETLVHANVEGVYHWADEHHVGLTANFMNSSYGNKELKGITRLRLTPYYRYEAEKVKMQLGVFVSTKGHVAPDVSLTYHLNSWSDVYVDARGYEEDNTYRRFSQIHPYFVLDGDGAADGKMKMEAAFHQMNARIGYRFKGLYGFSGDINGGFDLVKNAPNMDWISNGVDGWLYPWMQFQKRKSFYVNADIVYAYKDVVKVDAKNRLNVESNRYADKWKEGSYLSPAFEMNWKADFKLMKDLYLGLDWNLACYAKVDLDLEPASQYKRPNTVNLGASIRYTLPMDLPVTVFVKGDNLLNQNYDRYFGYRNIGPNFLAGFAMSF